MPIFENFSAGSAESDDDDDEELEHKSSSKSEKKVSIFGASVLKSSEKSTNKELPKKSEGLDRLLAELSFSKKEQQAEASQAEQPAARQAPENAKNEQNLPEVSEELVVHEVEAQGEAQVEQASLEAPEDAPEEVDDVAAEVIDTPALAETNAEDNTEATTATPVLPRQPSTSSGRPVSIPPAHTPSPAPTQTSSTSSRTVPMLSVPVAQQAAARAGTVASPNTLTSSSTNAAAANISPFTQEAVDDAEYYARTRGRREGVLAGLLLGGGIEHFRHKRRERKMEKDFTKKEKAHEKDLENLSYEQKREAMVKDLREAYEQRYKNSSESLSPVVAPARAEALAGSQASATAEQGKPASTQEAIELPPDHHIESSAWLNVEVDAQGNPVENSSFEYGAEYYRERAHEVRADDDNDDEPPVKKDSTVTKPPQEFQQSAPTMFAGSPLTSTPPAGVEQKPPLKPQTISTVTAPQRVIRAVASPPTTPLGTAIWSVALVVILIVIAVIIL